MCEFWEPRICSLVFNSEIESVYVQDNIELKAEPQHKVDFSDNKSVISNMSSYKIVMYVNIMITNENAELFSNLKIFPQFKE